MFQKVLLSQTIVTSFWYSPHSVKPQTTNWGFTAMQRMYPPRMKQIPKESIYLLGILENWNDY
jgi:hypothetical protein